MDKTQESQSTQLTVPVTAPTTTTPSTAIDSNPSLSSLVGNIAIHTSNVEPEDTQWGARFFIQQTTPTVTDPTPTPTATPPASPTNTTPTTSTSTSSSSFQYINKESELEQVDIEGELSM